MSDGPRQRLLEATAAGLTGLLQRQGDDAVRELLGRLAAATDVDRAYVAEHVRGPDDVVRVRLLHEWVAEGLDSACSVLDGRQGPAPSALRILAALERGECITARYSEMPADMQARFAPTKLRSVLTVPVEVGQRCWGQLGLVDCRTERSWTSDEQVILRTVAAALGLAIEGRRAHDELGRHIERIRGLHEAIATDPIDAGEQIERLLAFAADHLAFEIAMVLDIADDDVETCAVACVHGPPEFPKPSRVPLARTEWEQAVAQRSTTEIADFFESHAREHAAVTEFGMRSFLGVPVWVNGLPWGAVSFLSRQPRVRPFGPSDRDFVGLVGCWVGAFVERQQAESHRRLLEARLRERAKLDSLAIAFAGFAHDFSNMLMVITTNLHIAGRFLARGDAGEVLESLEQASQAAQQAADLKTQMLTFAGRGPLACTPVDVNALVVEMTDMLSTVMPSGVSIVPQCPPDLPPLEADATQLRQVLSNLVLNAADAMRDRRGSIWVRAGTQPFCAQPSAWFVAEDAPSGVYLWLEVEDAGTGIAPDIIGQIFDPFFTTKPGGRGLGLATVRGIASSHAGCIDIESRLDVGTRVRVWLPLAR